MGDILSQVAKAVKAVHEMSSSHGIPPLLVLVEGHTNCRDPAKRSNSYHMRLSEAVRTLAASIWRVQASTQDICSREDLEALIESRKLNRRLTRGRNSTSLITLKKKFNDASQYSSIGKGA